jgi:hypothetical protein
MLGLCEGLSISLVLLCISAVKFSRAGATCCGRYPAKELKKNGKYWEDDEDLPSEDINGLELP